MKLLPKTKYFFNIVLPFVLLFQWTLPTIEKKKNTQTNFGEVIYDKCKDPGHSHPPLSQRETSNDSEKFVNLDLNNSLFFKEDQKHFNISVEYFFEKPKTPSELLIDHFPPARSPPYLEV